MAALNNLQEKSHAMVEFKDVKQIVTLAMDLHGIIMPKPGEYRFQIFAGGYFLGERRILCRKVQLPPKAKPNDSQES